MLDHHTVAVVTAAASVALVELQTLKDQLGITDSAQDALLRRLLRTCGRAFEGIHGLRRPPWRQTYTEKRPGLGGYLLPLHRYPIESVSAVTYGVTSPDTVEASSYSIAEPDRSALYRAEGWNRSQLGWVGPQAAGDESLEYAATFIAGWLMPAQAPRWSAALAVAADGYVAPLDAALCFQADADGGTTDATEPSWPTTLGDTVVDNDITWTAVAARRLPEDLEEAAIIAVTEWFRGGLELPRGVQAEGGSATGVSTSYDAPALRRLYNPLPPASVALLEAYR